jgi:hypothetical protein
VIVSIMQPYFFPYLGYFQLFAASDVFVVHDDVQFIKGGWVNRNRILVAGRPEWITLPVAAARHEHVINERKYLLNHRLAARMLDRIRAAYQRAPQFRTVMELIEDVLRFSDPNVAVFNTHALLKVAAYLGIRTPMKLAIESGKDKSLAGEQLVVNMCRLLGASRYVNPIGGAALYRRESFAAEGIELSFLKSEPSSYDQFGDAFVPSLSILDVLMFNPLTRVQHMLKEYRLVQEDDGALRHG